ncbi:hypothetical protein MMH89_02045 [Candidatus Comchoanobacter bicostacola]|uniref:Uncharacterized protein n=1 Tax=Candidatus Comchoanobacter bicostacola TaxID=2919598 RepID=A0ABY5DKC3_9GAMM|nr:hypothetical protein [Candidatus Comchoanobacter bicostacola]UTC24930.1 hypothetical protein MMH89_02045 [Candidatus Comchoanobacter bicostacola]
MAKPIQPYLKRSAESSMIFFTDVQGNDYKLTREMKSEGGYNYSLNSTSATSLSIGDPINFQNIINALQLSEDNRTELKKFCQMLSPNVGTEMDLANLLAETTALDPFGQNLRTVFHCDFKEQKITCHRITASTEQLQSFKSDTNTGWDVDSVQKVFNPSVTEPSGGINNFDQALARIKELNDFGENGKASTWTLELSADNDYDPQKALIKILDDKLTDLDAESLTYELQHNYLRSAISALRSKETPPTPLNFGEKNLANAITHASLSLNRRLNIEVREKLKLMDLLYRIDPALKEYIDNKINFSNTVQFLETLEGTLTDTTIEEMISNSSMEALLDADSLSALNKERLKMQLQSIVNNKPKKETGMALTFYQQWINTHRPTKVLIVVFTTISFLIPALLIAGAYFSGKKADARNQVTLLNADEAESLLDKYTAAEQGIEKDVEQIQYKRMLQQTKEAKTTLQGEIPAEVAEKIWEQSGLSIETLNTNAYWSVVPSEKTTQSSQLFISSEDLKAHASDALPQPKDKLEKLIDLHLEVMQVDSEKVGNGKTLDHTKVISVSADEYVRNLSLVLDAGITDAKIAHDVALSVIKKLEQPDPEATVNMINSAQTLLSIHLAKQIAPQDRELMLLILESKRNEADAETICNKLIALKKQKDGGETVDKKTILNEIETALIGKSKTLKTKRNQVAPGPNITVVPKHSTTGVKAVSVGQGNPGQKQNLQDPSSKTPRSTFGKNQP